MKPHAREAPIWFCNLAAYLGAAVDGSILASAVWMAVVEAIILTLVPTGVDCYEDYLNCSSTECVKAKRGPTGGRSVSLLHTHCKHGLWLGDRVKLYVLQGYWRWEFRGVWQHNDSAGLSPCDCEQMQWTVHHILCWWAHGPPPLGLPLACHSACDNKLCLNPHHLRWGDQKANAEQARLHRAHVKRPRGCVQTSISSSNLTVQQKKARAKKGKPF